MSGITKSVGGFLGTSSGPQAQAGNYNNISNNELNDQNSIFSSDNAENAIQGAANSGNVQGELGQLAQLGLDTNQQQGLSNALATGATTGSQYATQQVQSNPLLSQGLNQIQGQLQTGQGDQAQQTGILNNLQSQGFNLTPGDQSLYGQESGSIARQFGQQGNQTAQDLAARGLSSSGAAGAEFSGVNGNQNEMLAQAQQQIAQQRFTNTQNQIAQQQNFIGQLNGQNNTAANNYSTGAAGDINQQYGRQLSGEQAQTGNLSSAAGLTNQANASENSNNLTQAGFNASNTPANIGDFYTAGLGSSAQEMGAGSGQLGAGMIGAQTGQKTSAPQSSMFGAGGSS